MSDRPPRVILVTEQVDAGGKRSHVESLRAGLGAIGWEAEVFDAHRLGTLDRAFIALPNRALEVLKRGAGHHWILPAIHATYSRRLRAFAGKHPADLWHAQEPLTWRAVREAAGGRPVALTVHGPVHREVASAYRLPLEDPAIRAIREVERQAYLGADAVISVDLAHAEYVKEFGRTERLWVIPNFVDTRCFHPAVEPARLAPEVEAWIGNRPLLLCPRRLVPKNGVAIALRATRVLADRGVSVALLVAGAGPQRAEMESLRRELGIDDRVWMIGDVGTDAMPGLCRRAAAVLVPSVPSAGVEEATSISALEGEACGRPVIASDLGGLREILVHERTGLLFRPGDAEALAGAIERVLADPEFASELGARACAVVREQHSHVAGARKYAEVYAQLGVGNTR